MLSIVQSKTYYSIASGVGSPELTFNAPTTAGSLIVVLTEIGYTFGSIGSIADSASQTYVQAKAFTDGNSVELEAWYFPNSVSITTVTVNFAGGFFPDTAVTILEIAGAVLTSPLDAAVSAGATSAGALTIGTLTPSESNEILLMWGAVTASSPPTTSVITPGESFVQVGQGFANNGSSNISAVMSAAEVVSSTSPVAASMTWTPNTSYAAGIALSFKGVPVQAPINLLSNIGVAVSAGSTIVNTGNTVLNGDLDLSPGSVVTGFPPGIVTGTKHIDDATAVQSQLDLTTAFTQAMDAPGAVTIASALDAVTLDAGVYTSGAGTFSLAGGTLTLDAQGNPNAVWIFQMATTLVTGAGSTIVVINGGFAANVFWQVGSSATIGANNTFVGTIMAGASITLTPSGTTVTGHLLASAEVAIGDAEVILPGAVTYVISGNVGILGAGATVNLTGTSTGSTVADSFGNYKFTELVNGTYTVTPVFAGVTFVPTSRSPIINSANQTGVNFTSTENPSGGPHVPPIVGTIFADKMMSPSTSEMESGTGIQGTAVFG